MAAEPAPVAPVLPDRYVAKHQIKKEPSTTCSELWICRDLDTDTHVVIKVLPSWAHNFPEVIERFRSEAECLQQIEHRNVITMLDGFTEPDWGIVMEYAGQHDLWEWIQPRPRLDDRMFVARQMARAVAAVHAAGLLHFDIKLGNFIINDRKRIKLGDFGLAVPRTLGRPIARDGRVVGTVYYMSPESVLGNECDERSDIYSLGAALYVLFSGRLMFDGASKDEIGRKHLQAQPVPLSDLCVSLRRGVVDLIHACLEKRPEDRPQLAVDVMVGLAGQGSA